MTTSITNNPATSTSARLLITPESAWGEAPSTAFKALAKVLPFTSEGLTYTPTTITSDTITDYRAASDLILTNRQAEGTVDAEFTGQNFDHLLKAALLSTGSTGSNTDASSWHLINTDTDSLGTLTLTGGYSFQNQTTGGAHLTFSQSSAAIRTALGGLLKGQVIVIKGGAVANGAINGTYTVLSTTTTSNSVVVRTLEAFGTISTGTMTNEASSATTVSSQRIADGNTANDIDRQSFLIEKQFRIGGAGSLKNKYFLYRGMYVQSVAFTVSAQSLATISLSFLGKDSEAHEDGDPLFSSINTAQNASGLSTAQLLASRATLGNTGVNGSSDFSAVYVDGALQGLVGSITFTVNNNLRAQNALGTTGAVNVAPGSSEVTGSVDILFENLNTYNKFINNETSSIQFRFTTLDAAGEILTYQAYFPKVKFSNVSQPISGANTDIITTASFTALYDDDSKASVLISKA